MTDPDRSPWATEPGSRRAGRDDRVLGAVMLVLGGLRVAIALGDHEVWGAEATIAGAMVALGVVLVCSGGRR